MRTLTGAALAAVNAVITSPGHLVGLTFPGDIFVRWSDIGQVTMTDGTTWAGVDMKIARVSFSGDAAPAQFSLQVSNLDSSIGALMLANDMSAVPVMIQAFDRAALNVADVVGFGNFVITQTRIGIDSVELVLSPVFYTAPYRRVDAPNGFRFAASAGTKITWGRESLILDRLNDWYYEA